VIIKKNSQQFLIGKMQMYSQLIKSYVNRASVDEKK